MNSRHGARLRPSPRKPGQSHMAVLVRNEGTAGPTLPANGRAGGSLRLRCAPTQGATDRGVRTTGPWSLEVTSTRLTLLAPERSDARLAGPASPKSDSDPLP